MCLAQPARSCAAQQIPSSPLMLLTAASQVAAYPEPKRNHPANLTCQAYASASCSHAPASPVSSALPAAPLPDVAVAPGVALEEEDRPRANSRALQRPEVPRKRAAGQGARPWCCHSAHTARSVLHNT